MKTQTKKPTNKKEKTFKEVIKKALSMKISNKELQKHFKGSK